MRQLKITKQITNRSGKSMEVYLQEVAKEPMITLEEEVELAQKIRRGDEAALKRLVKANLRFVISVAKQYQHNGLELEDLINEGNLGLIEAAKRYDETRGFKFISYAVWWIRQSMLKAITDKSRSIRMPGNRALDARKIAEAAIKIEQENERMASEEEIGELIEMKPDDVREVMKLIQKQGSIDAPMREGDDRSSTLSAVLEDVNIPSPTDGLMNESLIKEIEDALDGIDEKEAEVIRLSFGLTEPFPMSLKDISKKMGISPERIRQIKKRALISLMRSSNSKRLRAYL